MPVSHAAFKAPILSDQTKERFPLRGTESGVYHGITA
jgi:hypothetical protein